MSLTLRIFLIILLLIFMALIIYVINHKKISMRYASLWLLMLLILILVTIFPNLIIALSNFLGFETTSNMVFLLGFFVLAYIIFLLTIYLSDQQNKIKNLVQEL